MVKHIVMCKLKDTAEGAGKKEKALKMKAGLEGLKYKIKEIKFLEVGLTITEAPDFYDIVLITEFKDVDAMAVYQKNPDHKQAAEFIGKVSAERKVVDYIV